MPELSPADSDQVVVPDLDAVYVCPWDTSMAIIFSDLYWEDAPYNVCPRQALKRAMKEAAEEGYTGLCRRRARIHRHEIRRERPAGESLRRRPWCQAITPRRQAFGYDVEYSIDSMPFLKDMIDIIEESGLEPA